MNNFFSKVTKHNLPVSLLFLALSIFRSPDALTTPMLYAEDGVWLTQGVEIGWVSAAFNSRPDYPTLIHAIALWFSASASQLLSGNPLWLAAVAAAVVGYVIWAGTATYIYISFKKFSSTAVSLLVAMGFIFMPLGSTSNETVGRILQLGFIVPVLLSLVVINGFGVTNAQRIASGLFVISLALTSPIVIPIWCAWYLFESIKAMRQKYKFDQIKFATVVILLIIGAGIWFREPSPSAIPGGLNQQSLLETILARSLLFPELAAIYRFLSDTTVVLIFLGMFSLAFAIVRTGGSNSAARSKILPIAFVWITYLLGTLASRPGLTGFLDSYQSTYPDRYFLGLNTIAWLLFCTIVITFTQRSKGTSKRAGSTNFALVLLGGLVFVNVIYSTEILGTRQNISYGTDWQYRLCNPLNQNGPDGRVTIALEPHPDWTVSVRPELVKGLPC